MTTSTSILQHKQSSSLSLANDFPTAQNIRGREKRRALSNNSLSSSTTTPATPSLTFTKNTLESPKLRASCDGCYLAKIKCGKERPQCGRCANHGITCQYSPSQRIGKPRRMPVATTENTASASSNRRSVHLAGTAQRNTSPLSLTHNQNHETLSVSDDQGTMEAEQASNSNHHHSHININDKASTPIFEWPFHLTPPTSETSGSDAALPLTPGLSTLWNQSIYNLPQPSVSTADRSVGCPQPPHPPRSCTCLP